MSPQGLVPLHSPVSFSVVIPAYNSERFLASAIASGINQTRPALEIFVVDDGSTDDTATVASSFNDHKVTLLQTEHCGSACARNAATPRATGDYIAYLDADDQWHPDKLQRFGEAIEKAGFPALFFSDFHRVDLETGVRLARNSELNPQLSELFSETQLSEGRELLRFSPDDALTVLASGYPMYPSAFAVRTDALKAVGGWDERWQRSSDFELCLRMAKRWDFAYLDDDLTVIGRHGGHGSLAAYVLRQTEWDVAALRHHWRDPMLGPKNSETLQRGFADTLAGLAWHLRRADRWGEARGCYRELATIKGKKVKAGIYFLVTIIEQLFALNAIRSRLKL